MEDLDSHSPPLAPDPAQASQQQQPKIQPFQDQFIAPSPASQAPQQLEQPTTTPLQPTSRPVIQQPQPIRDAVDRAFGQSQPPNALDPAFIAQVTEAVVKNLQSANLNQRTPAAPPTSQYPPPPTVQSVPQSPALSSDASLPFRYTPPSPNGRDRNDNGSRASASPVSMFSDGENSFGKGSVTYGSGKLSDRDGDTPKPAFGDTKVGSRLNESIREDQEAEDLSKVEEGRAPEAPSSRRSSRDSYGSASAAFNVHIPPPKMSNSAAEATTLERIWQPLFENGNPTVRLSQFLRGIALHITEDYEPKGSLVITPPKMLRFFEETKILDELYPWHLVFGGGMVSASISVMFRRLKCQHHLVQTQLHEVPNVPGLTPTGFETFLTCLIQAHPDLEFERLSRAVMDMPISNADYKTERFPKELSRRLFPARPNPISEQCIIASMAHEANMLKLRNSDAMPPPPPPTSAPSQSSTFQERQRNPYSQSSFSAEVNEHDTDTFVPSVPIERERKPYFAKEGTGKVFGSDSVRDEFTGASQARPDDHVHMPAPRPTYYDHNTASPDIRTAPPPRKHRSSVGPGMPPISQMPGASYPKGRRSPPPSSSYVRSDPVNLGDIPAAQYASNLHGSRQQGHFDRDQFDENPYHHTSRRGHNTNTMNNNSFEEDLPQGSGKAKPIPPRANQAPPLPPAGTNGYDSSYGSASAGSYPGPRARNYEDRRRSMYGGPPGMNSGGGSGGSDGWGSYANGSGAPGMYLPQQGYGNAGVQH